MGATDISWAGLALSLVLVLTALMVSYWQGLALERRLMIGSARTTVQLLLTGWVLGYIISAERAWLVLAAITFQLAVAVWTAASLVQPRLAGSRLIALYAMIPTYLSISLVLIFVVVNPQPWWNPRVVLPLGGMLLGNTLTAVALALNRYRGGVRDNRELIEARLALGVPWPLAVAEQRQEAAAAAMLPTVAAMLTVGVVSLPGMMTGQIIAGADPLTAVKYQIVVMFMLAAATALAAAIALVHLTRRAKFEAWD